MKIAGKTPGINKGVIEFHRPGGNLFRLVVQAVPYGFPERIEREIPTPDPPVEFARDPKTGAILRDESGFAVKTERKGDRKWQTEASRARALRVVLHAREALRCDPSVEFESDKASPRLQGRAYAEAVEKEFAEAGFSDREILDIFFKAGELNRGAAQRVSEAAESFLSGTPAGADGKSPSEPAEPTST